MGLFSYIKKRYYGYKLNKADKLLKEGRAAEAEQAYLKILNKQSLAASRLVDYYCSIAQNSNVKNIKELFVKAIDLEKNSSSVYDVEEYDKSLANFSKFVVSKAESLFVSAFFEDSWNLLCVVNSSKNKTEATLDLCCEARVNHIYKCVKTLKITDLSFNKYINDLSSEWLRGKKIQCLLATTKSFCDDLETNHHFYISNIILGITKISGYQERCLDNALNIVSSKDKDASSIQLKETVSLFGKSIILRKGNNAADSATIFKNCWSSSKDVKVILEVLKGVKDVDTKDAFVTCIFNNHKDFLSEKSLLEGFSKWLYQESDASKALLNLEKMKDYGYDVESLYVNKLADWVKNQSTDEQVNHLDHGQSLYPESSTIISLKLECAKKYESIKENDKAISVADSIAKKCPDAYIVKSKALYNIAGKETDIEKKENILNDANKVIKKVLNAESRDVKEKINYALLDVANEYYNGNKHDKSYAILIQLGNGGFGEAIFCIAKLKSNEVKAITNASDKLDAANAAIDEINRFKFNAVLNNTDFQSLWIEKSSACIEICKGKDNLQASNSLEQFVKEVESIGFESSFSKSLTKSAKSEIIKRKYLIARDLELSKQFEKASDLYKSINSLEAKRTPTLSALRFILCKLKMQNSSDILNHKEQIYSLLRNSAEAYKLEKEDISYRFAFILLKSGEDKEALAVLNEFLPSEEYLKRACEQGDIIKAQAKLDDFNKKLDDVKNKTLSSDDAIYFINHMLEYAEIIKPILTITRPTLTKYRNKLKNYAIYKLFDEERYNIAFEKMLKEHSDYLEDYSALRNIALLCLNMAESKQITHSNYKDVVAVWLTAMYQEILFIKSLDFTSWDDQFTFSLYDAYGHFNESTHDDLPDNVNFDDSNDSSIVSIKEVQRSLLDRFEAAIGDDQEYHNFFTSQKEAMDAFIALNLDEKCRIVAPYLAKSNDEVFNGISSSLEWDREREYDNWEDVLSVGAIYHMSQPIYNDYKNAKSYYDACMESLDNFSTSRANTIFQESKITLIKKFRKLHSALISCANSKISALSATNKTDFKKKFDFYNVVCNSIKDKTLSFVFSNFVMSFVVSQVNDKKMKLAEAADYILSAYMLDYTNTRVKDNLKTLFEMLCRETATESVTAVNGILSKTRTCDTSFYNSLNNEYQDAKIYNELNSIVDKVNRHSMSESDALSKIYTLYVSHPDHPGICSNLAQLSEICIMKYIIHNEYGSSSVKSVLTKLKNNKSTEFRTHSSEFRKAYNDIWNQLPFETQQLLSDGILAIASGKTLNSNGLALKDGLEWFKELGGFTNSSRRSSLFGGLDNYPF